MARTTKQATQPLPPAVFHLLLALRDGEQHGYTLMHRVEELTDGTVRMGPGTLYGAIKRMLADGLIEESDERPDPALDDQRRRYYRITAPGERVCAAEVTRLETLLRNARRARPEAGAHGMNGERTYRALLHLYPRSFRREYRVADGAAVRRRAARSGPARLADDAARPVHHRARPQPGGFHVDESARQARRRRDRDGRSASSCSRPSVVHSAPSS